MNVKGKTVLEEGADERLPGLDVGVDFLNGHRHCCPWKTHKFGFTETKNIGSSEDALTKSVGAPAG